MTIPYLAQTLGSTPEASRIKMGVLGLWCFIVGYARFRNDLCPVVSCVYGYLEWQTYLQASLP